MNCLEVSSSGRVILFKHTLPLRTDGVPTETLEERINLNPGGSCTDPREQKVSREAYTKLTVRKIVVWRRQATESLARKTIALGMNDVLQNYVASGIDAAEGTFVWNYTVRSCQQEELEELYNGRIGFFEANNGSAKGSSVVLDGFGGGQRAWLRMGQGVTICSRRMRQTHLPHVYME
jgi:hypothetical protein